MCTQPLLRYEARNAYKKAKDGHVYNKFWIDNWEEYECLKEDEKEKFKEKYQNVQKIPCGQCRECLLNRSREWANRLMLEKKYYPDELTWFITLTYRDEHLHFHHTVDIETGEEHEGASLYVKDTQDFMKKLRRHYEYQAEKQGLPKPKIRYFLAGEYGSQGMRPHYHIIFFGLPLDQTKLKIHTHNENGQPIWKHEEIEKIWGKGFITVGRVTWESAAYVARYNTKKYFGEKAKWYYGNQGIIPEFTTCSREPAIGIRYLQENAEDIYTTDRIAIANTSRVNQVPPPKAFDRYMKKINPEFMEELSKERQRKAELAEKDFFRRTDIHPIQYRRNKEQHLIERTNALIRDL